MKPADELLRKITDRKALVGVIGLGYVGLPLVREFCAAGFKVLGFDVDPQKVAMLKSGRTYIRHLPARHFRQLIRQRRFTPTTDMKRLSRPDAILICVPTPLDKMREPDMSFVVGTTRQIAATLRKGQLVTLESTTYPGTTTEVVQPILESGSKLRAGQDFYLAFSPERIDPGNKQWSAYNTPKVVGGLNPQSTAVAAAFLRQMGAPVHEVSSPSAAELTELLENTFRAVNIALVNELSILAERMGIDFWEVIEAAKTKPFGFMPFSPGPGVGGHCIPIDPYYLLWKAREYDFYTRFIELAAETNETMPYHVVDLVTRGLSCQGKSLHGAEVLVLGVAFKPDIGDPRNSPAERVIELLMLQGATVRYHDPFIPVFQVGGNAFLREGYSLESVPLDVEQLTRSDAVVIVTGHREVDYAAVLKKAALVVDSCNATYGLPAEAPVVRLGAPFFC